MNELLNRREFLKLSATLAVLVALVPRKLDRVEWKELNLGCWAAYYKDELVGLVFQSQKHPDVMNPGLWGAVWRTADGSLQGTGCWYQTSAEAREVLAKNLAYLRGG